MRSLEQRREAFRRDLRAAQNEDLMLAAKAIQAADPKIDFTTAWNRALDEYPTLRQEPVRSGSAKTSK